MDPTTKPMMPRFKRSFWVAVILLILACIFAEVGFFVIRWPAQWLFLLPAFLFSVIGVVMFAVSVFKDRKVWRTFATQVHLFTVIVLGGAVVALLWLNLKPRVYTTDDRVSDQIIKTTSHGWPFPLHQRYDIKAYVQEYGEFEFGPDLGYSRPYRQFVDQVGISELWPFLPWNLLHWFLMLFVILLICESFLRKARNREGRG